MENDKIKQILENNKCIVLEPNAFHKGHGHTISIKVVLPTFCQANCDFCFNKYKNTKKYDIDRFLDNLDKSLNKVFSNVKREFTIDITGNEPTFNVGLLKETLTIINKYRKYIEQIVMTTNGYRLKECLPFIDMLDIVNISIHHYDFNQRKEIFKTNNIPNDEELKEIIRDLKSKNIKVSAICVLNNDVGDFKDFYNNLTNWAYSEGFDESRIRSNFMRNDGFIDDIFDIDIGKVVESHEVPGLKLKKVYDSDKNYSTYILKGVESLVSVVIGLEMVIDDDGLLYIDYDKNYPITDESLEYFKRIYFLGDLDEKIFK